jgi:hypothetical protein
MSIQSNFQKPNFFFYIGFSLLISANLISPLSSEAGPLDVWHLRDSGLQGITLNGITFGNGMFVAVGEVGTILTSPDGVNWTARSSGTTNELRGIAFGNGVFVAVGLFGTILTSTDGITWTTQTSETGTPSLEGVALGNAPNPIFVVVGPSGTILTSLDGVNWTAQVSGTPDAFFFDVTQGNGIFVVIVGLSSVLTSSDGISWTPSANPIIGGPRRIAFGNGTFVAVGWFVIHPSHPFAAISISLDGTVWSQSAQLVDQLFDGVTFGGGVFVVVGWPGAIQTSVDGVTWTPRSSGSNSRLLAVAHGNGTFVAVGEAGTILQSDPPYILHDVPPTNFAFTQIEAIRAAGITGGCAATPPLFCPDDTITRGQMAVFIETSLGKTAPPCIGTLFDDVAEGSVGPGFCGFIEQLAADGITGGCTATNFCPDLPITRDQMAVFIEAALGVGPAARCSGTVFSDVNVQTVGDLFCRYIEDFAAQGITGGCAADDPLTPDVNEAKYCPFDPVTRAEMAVFLVAAPAPLLP